MLSMCAKKDATPPPPILPGTPYPMGLLPWLWAIVWSKPPRRPSSWGVYRVRTASPIRHSRKGVIMHPTTPHPPGTTVCAPIRRAVGERYGGEQASIIRQAVHAWPLGSPVEGGRRTELVRVEAARARGEQDEVYNRMPFVLLEGGARDSNIGKRWQWVERSGRYAAPPSVAPSRSSLDVYAFSRGEGGTQQEERRRQCDGLTPALYHVRNQTY
ncbi:hypothetical protein LZ30DRAFT_387414 [Colletotrichum cereale]|nr:hypothetical protein LZ30DRAFT_387414 [Colletotrichum cereale]